MPKSCLRFLTWLALAALISQTGPVVAAESALPVATNIAGSVAVKSSGATQDIVSTRILHSGDTILTGVSSLAVVSLADVGKIMLGPGTTATAYAQASKLSLQLGTGSLCVQSQEPNLVVNAGPLSVWSAASSTLFNIARSSARTEIAVYRGSVSTSVNGAKTDTLQAGVAVISSNGQPPAKADIGAVNADFAALNCPDQSIVAQVVSAPNPSPAAPSSGGGSAAGILGILLGLGAVAAAVGHGGGGAAATQPAAPTPAPSPVPTPTPSPSILPTASPSILPSISPLPSPTPTPSSTATPSGSLSLSPSSLQFGAPGDKSEYFTAKDDQASSFSASSSNPLVAVVQEMQAKHHSAEFNVTPTGPGTATIAVIDNAGNSGPVSVTVGSGSSSTSQMRSMDQIMVQPSTMVIARGAQGTFSVSERRYTGMFRVVSAQASLGSITPSTGNGPLATFTVFARNAGSLTVTIADELGHAATLRIVIRSR